MQILILTLCLAVTSISSFAREAPQFINGVRGKRLVIEENGVRLQGYRFLNADGRPNTGKFIVFTHGLHSNLHEFEHLVKAKMAEGYDCFAFNFRGHGNGDEKSLVLNYQDGDYKFEKMAREDLPLIMRTVQELSGLSGYIIGHSMGGMVPRAALVLGLLDTSNIESFVLIGSPPHFRNPHALNDSLIARRLIANLNSGRGDAPVGFGELTSYLETSLDMLNIGNPIYWLAKSGLRFQARIIKGLAGILLGVDSEWSKRSMTTSIPKDILRSFLDFQKNYPYDDISLPVPALYIAGDRDVLVNIRDIESSAETQSGEAGFSFITLSGVGHLSLVAPQALRYYGDQLSSFLEDPTAQMDRTWSKHRPNICDRFLLGI